MINFFYFITDIYIFAIGNPVYDDVLKPLTVGIGIRHYFRLNSTDKLDEIFEEIISKWNLNNSLWKSCLVIQ